MYSIFLNSLFLVLTINCLSAQNYNPSGARAAGMGNAVVTVSDEWSCFQNIAGLANQKKITSGLWYKTDYALRACRESSAHLVGPLLKGGLGISVYRYGNEVYSVNRISLGYAHKISFVSLGIKLNYVQVAMQDLGVGKTITIDFGGIAELIPSKLFFGATLNNLNQAIIKKELLPVTMKVGISYRPTKNVMLNTEVEKDLIYKPTIKVGLEYVILKKISLRTGINTHPFVNFFGVGFQTSIFQLDYALSKHVQLGYSHCLSLLVFFNKIK